MRILVVVQTIGGFLRLFGLAFLVPCAVSLLYGERYDATVFLGAGLFSAATGHVMTRNRRSAIDDLKRVEGLAIVAGAWLLLSWSAAIPYLGAGMGPIDAMFESMSGLTTTGASVMSGLDAQPRGILLWRAMLHWFGGIGIVVMAVAILPALRVGGAIRPVFS